MNFLKNLAEQDFVSQKDESGQIDVMVKKLNELGNEYICIRKDYLMILNDMFNDREEELNRVKKQLNDIKEIILNDS